MMSKDNFPLFREELTLVHNYLKQMKLIYEQDISAVLQNVTLNRL